MNPLLRNDNPYLRQTEWKARPSRQDPAWRLRPEHELLEAVDQWDLAEAHRRQVEANVAALNADARRRAAEEARVKQEREDTVIDDELRRRYLAGGGSEASFIVERQQLRRDFARKVALGEAEPLTPSIDQIKAELRQLRGHRLAMPDPRP